MSSLQDAVKEAASALKDIKIKNNVPQNLPPAMWLNTLGSVMKIREGPEVGSMP